MINSWRPSTRKQYISHIQKWMKFANERKFNPSQIDYKILIEFLTSLYKQGLSYSSINSARSAISSISDNEIGSHHIVRRFMKGIFQSRPALPRYTTTWDPDIVLQFLKNLGSSEGLSLKNLSLKTVFMLTLFSARRGNTIVNIHVDNIHFDSEGVTIILGDLTKTSGPNCPSPHIIIKKFSRDADLCVHNVLNLYLQKTQTLRGNHKQLFISYQSPYGPISRDTLGRWLKEVMKSAGIDIQRFKPHSVRSASTSAAFSNKVPITSILASVGWKEESTFRRFYNKPLNQNTGEMAKALTKNF